MTILFPARRLASSAVALAVLVSGAACTPQPESQDGAMSDSSVSDDGRDDGGDGGSAELDYAALPSAQEEIPRARALIEDLGRIVEESAPVGPWEWKGNDDRVQCDSTPEVGKLANGVTASYTAKNEIPADQFEKIQRALVDRAKQEGFSYDGAYVNDPGNWDISLVAPDGRSLALAGKTYLVFQARTGCRRDTFEGDMYQYMPELRPENRTETTPGG